MMSTGAEMRSGQRSADLRSTSPARSFSSSCGQIFRAISIPLGATSIPSRSVNAPNTAAALAGKPLRSAWYTIIPPRDSP